MVSSIAQAWMQKTVETLFANLLKLFSFLSPTLSQEDERYSPHIYSIANEYYYTLTTLSSKHKHRSLNTQTILIQ